MKLVLVGRRGEQVQGHREAVFIEEGVCLGKAVNSPQLRRACRGV